MKTVSILIYSKIIKQWKFIASFKVINELLSIEVLEEMNKCVYNGFDVKIEITENENTYEILKIKQSLLDK
jgi:hypothetical protein